MAALSAPVGAADTPTGAERAAANPSVILGLDIGDEPVTVSMDGRVVEELSVDSEAALVRLTGAIVLDADEERLEELAWASVEASDIDLDARGEDRIEHLTGLLVATLSQPKETEDVLSVVSEQCSWRTCGLAGDVPDVPDLDIEEVVADEPDSEALDVSNEGVCSLATLDELNELAPLGYDSSFRSINGCTYLDTDYDAFEAEGISVSIDVAFDADAESMAVAAGATQELVVADRRAWTGGDDGFALDLYAQAGPDALHITVWSSSEYPEGIDGTEHAVAVAKLLAPRLAVDRDAVAATAAEPIFDDRWGRPLCDPSLREVLSQHSGLDFYTSEIDDFSCGFFGRSAAHSVSAMDGFGAYDEYEYWLSDEPTRKLTLAGRRALARGQGEFVVELPPDDPEFPEWKSSLIIWVFLEPDDDSLSASAEELAALVVENVIRQRGE